jgi:Superfamily I DNA and RNA helicases and helicase subunits
MIPLHLRPLKMLAVGDPKQLPASVTSQKAIIFGLDRSLMDRLMFSCGGEHVMLDVQYRMKPEICQFPSFMFYEDKLKSAEGAAMQSLGCQRSGLNTKPYKFIHIAGKEVRTPSGSYYNQEEAVAIVNLVAFLRNESKSCNISNWGSVKMIRIITFYNGQVQVIKKLLQSKGLGHVMVATVDSSQGSESDVVILSFVRSMQGVRKSVGFLDDDRRVNVALTRARFKLFSFGNAHTLSTSGVPTLTSMIDDAKKRGIIVREEGTEVYH